MLLPKAESGPQRSRRKAGSEAQATHPWPGWGQGGSQAKRTRGDVWGVGGRKAGALVLLDFLREASGLLSALFSGPLKAWLRMRKTCGVKDVQHPTPTPPHPTPCPLWSCLELCQLCQLSSVAQSCPTETSWTAARQASLSVANSQSLLNLMSIELVMGP